MPELPEVETVARQLAPELVGRRIKAIRILDDKLLQDYSPLLNARISAVYRVGKQIVIQAQATPGTSAWLAVHLRMTGRLQVLPGKKALDEKHLRAVLDMDRGRLLFRDARRFGTLTLADSAEGVAAPGIDPLSREFTATVLQTMLQGSRSPLKNWLLRQDCMTGIGNIYASEILFACGLHPQRAAGSLEEQEVRLLCRETRRILRAAIRHCGTTFSDFQDSRGVEGSYQRYLKVYMRREPCPKCGTAIERLVQQQRSTWFCPCCQALPSKGKSRK